MVCSMEKIFSPEMITTSTKTCYHWMEVMFSKLVPKFILINPTNFLLKQTAFIGVLHLTSSIMWMYKIGLVTKMLFDKSQCGIWRTMSHQEESHTNLGFSNLGVSVQEYLFCFELNRSTYWIALVDMYVRQKRCFK